MTRTHAMIAYNRRTILPRIARMRLRLVVAVFTCAAIWGCAPALYSVDMRYVPIKSIPEMKGSEKKIKITVAAFERWQDQLLGLLAAADGLPIDRVQMTSPFNARMRYNLYAGFSTLPRSLRQILSAWLKKLVKSSRYGWNSTSPTATTWFARIAWSNMMSSSRFGQVEFKFEEFDTAGTLVRERLVPLYTRYTFRDELQLLLERAGLEMVEVYRDYEKQLYDGTGELIALARRPAK